MFRQKTSKCLLFADQILNLHICRESILYQDKDVIENDIYVKIVAHGK